MVPNGDVKLWRQRWNLLVFCDQTLVSLYVLYGLLFGDGAEENVVDDV